MPAPPKLKMILFPACLQLSTKTWLFMLLQMGTLDAMLHCASKLFSTSLYVYDTAKGNSQVRLGINLFSGGARGARLPISYVRNEPLRDQQSSWTQEWVDCLWVDSQ